MSGKISQRFALKGFEELTSFFRMVEDPQTVDSPSMANGSQQVVVVDTDSYDFKDLPPFHVSQHTSD